MSEYTAVQRPMCTYAERIGWAYVPHAEALRLRGGEAGPFFRDVLLDRLQRLNPGVVDAARAAEIARRLALLPPTIEGNRDALAWLQGDGSVFVPEERRERNVRLIDFDSPDNNAFHVTDEWRHKGARFANRADVVFLVNGIPVAVAETKKAGLPDGLALGIEQIRRYHRETPEMLVTPQVFEVTELFNFFYGVTWSTSRKALFNWKDQEPGNYELKVTHFFDRARFLRVLRDYIVFLTRDDALSKIMLRQHQTRAVEKVIERVYDPTRRRGLVWHTQARAKNCVILTIAARLLRDAGTGRATNEDRREAGDLRGDDGGRLEAGAPSGDGGAGWEKPTVLMIVDRDELEAQLFKHIAAYGIGNVQVAESKRDLQRLLDEDYRGLIVSMIHKFDDTRADSNPRHSVVVLVDEAHRTTGGDLGNYLMGALPNATYIGFTGTPIDNLSKGKGTFKVFGGDDAQGYLDKYSIAESIEDGTTVRLNYALAPSDLRVDRATLERQFLDLADAEGVSDVAELNGILERAVELKEMMKAPERVERIARHVAAHFRENVEPMGFKAFLVGVDREACALYKQALDRYLPPSYSRVVYSPAHNDAAMLKEYYLTPDEEKEVRKGFARKGTEPKILIVTEKLLTGFDAPILYCMYLDKPMRDHVLLQAIARVNRPYEDDEGQVKRYGFVLDFVGIFEKLESALAFDSDVVASVIQNVDVLKRLFETYMREKASAYLPLTRGWDDKAKERAVEHFVDKATREEFFRFFQQLQSLYDILSPDAFLRPYVEPYQALAELYGLVRAAYADRVYVDRELTAKTRALLQRQTESGALELPGTIHALGAEELAALKRSGTTDTTKVLNLRKALATTVEREGGAKPFLISIGERAEALAQLYEDRQVTTREALEEFERLAREYVEGDAARRELGLDENAYAVYGALKLAIPGATADQAREIDALFGSYPDYEWDQGQANGLRAALYKALRPLVGKDFIAVTNTLMKLQRV